MANTINVKYQSHFKLYILFKDNILFENELIKKNIDYFLDKNQTGSLENFRYFLLDKNRAEIDVLLKKMQIIGSIESLNIIDFKQAKKVYSLYLYAAIISLIIILIVMCIFDK
jgi:hypothetical protein